MNKDPYKVLELPEDASFDQIKDRYRHLSKLLHPDKQPLENYQMAQEQFKQIDEAFKSISSGLRRHVYKHFGYPGIRVLDACPYEFQAFEKANLLDPKVQNELTQLIYYFLLEEHASMEHEKNKLKSRTVFTAVSSRDPITRIPKMDRNEFQFETSLPNFKGFTHTLNIIQTSQGLISSKNASDLVFSLSSTKRLIDTVMLNAHFQLASDKLGIEAGIDKVVSNNLVLHFSPIQFDGAGFAAPQVGADYHNGSFYTSAVTDFDHLTMQFGVAPPNKSSNKMIKISFDSSTVSFSPVYERDIGSKLRVFVHLQTQAQVVSPTETTIGFGLMYGYRLKVMDEMKLELSSFIGPQNNFQVSLTTPNFKVSFPLMANNHTDFYAFEMRKLIAFASVYALFQLYEYYKSKAATHRKRVEYENYNRLSVEKNLVLKENADIGTEAVLSRQFEIKNNGLVVLLAYIGEESQVKKVMRKIRRSTNKRQIGWDQVLFEQTQRLREQFRTNIESFDHQLYEVTDIVQAKVKGSQLLSYNYEEIGVNPCLSEKSHYWSLTYYWLRGEQGLIIQESSKPLTLGGLRKKYQKSGWSRLVSFIGNILSN